MTARATRVRAIPAMEIIVGISLKNTRPKIIAATGSHDARIEALPGSIYCSAVV